MMSPVCLIETCSSRWLNSSKNRRNGVALHPDDGGRGEFLKGHVANVADLFNASI